MTTDPRLQSETAVPHGSTRLRLAGRLIAGVTVLGCALAGMSGVASAAPGDTSGDSVDAHVAVTSAIALTGLTSNFTLVGLPGATVTSTGAVTMVVSTNNIAGYAVTVQASAPTLVGDTPGNTDSIPIGALKVRETGNGAYTSVSDAGAVTVHSQNARSAEAGDIVNNDYRVVIPFVDDDTYSVSLNYIATTL